MDDLFKNLFSEIGDFMDKNLSEELKSYYYSLSKTWENDKLVRSEEKEYENGKCLKDVKYVGSKEKSLNDLEKSIMTELKNDNKNDISQVKKEYVKDNCKCENKDCKCEENKVCACDFTKAKRLSEEEVLRKECKDLSKSFDKLSEQYKKVVEERSNLFRENQDLKNQIADLEKKLEKIKGLL